MINCIPESLRSKICTYEFEIHGVKVRAKLVDNSSVVVAKIDVLKFLLKHSKNRVVGIDVKYIQAIGQLIGVKLVLCVGHVCLVIQLFHLDYVPDVLKLFLADETICFLGTGMSNIVRALEYDLYGINITTSVEVVYFAAKILKKPNIEMCGLVELASEVGMDIKEPIIERPDWNAIGLSQGQIKYAVHNAYTSYVIGNKLLGML